MRNTYLSFLDSSAASAAAFAAAVQKGVDLLLVGEEDGADDRVVQDGGSFGGGVHAPDQEGDLDGVEEGQPVQNEVDERLEEAEHAVDDPVGQPLGVVGAVLRLDGLDGGIHGVQEADQVADKAGAEAEEHKDSEQYDEADGDVLAVNLGLLLDHLGILLDHGGLQDRAPELLELYSKVG
eukprot:CAMPEP_0116963866 /NCGR_PEP_ID=MMETSP0467-20121206/48197_1 /TAXON_ID=283647 /ORGANISM="Mesodinium pulex, Strain SPMC105" /LENGTH=179 /DNA_ID=CAMNT_0004652639 /DNA_START=120 /DNA_END=655 /DNA_ORIENTATION=-